MSEDINPLNIDGFANYWKVDQTVILKSLAAGERLNRKRLNELRREATHGR